MKRKIIRGGVKAILFVMGFIAVSCMIIQPLFLPKNEGTVIVNGFYKLPRNSLDVLCVGPSQCFCTINTVKLTNEYGISSYDLGSSAQRVMTTYYYLKEALKKQNPELVMVEVCEFFYSDEEFAEPPQENEIAWNYYPMRFSLGKFASMYERFHGDMFAVIRYCLFPFVSFHTRWNTFTKTDFVTDNPWEMDVERGFLRRDDVEPLELAYTSEDAGEERELPQQTRKAILDIANLCKRKGIEVIFFKAPVGNWTRNDAKTVKSYMQEQGLLYLELNDCLDEIGIDPAMDFYNVGHLNTSGANKTTDFIAQYLMDNYQLGKQTVQ